VLIIQDSDFRRIPAPRQNVIIRQDLHIFGYEHANLSRLEGGVGKPCFPVSQSGLSGNPFSPTSMTTCGNTRRCVSQDRSKSNKHGICTYWRGASVLSQTPPPPAGHVRSGRMSEDSCDLCDNIDADAAGRWCGWVGAFG
jgi:hypothetical protein